MEEQCVFCKKGLDDGEEIVVLREKGCETFNKDGQILDSDVSTYPDLRVHKNCRRDFCKHKDVLPDLIIEQTLMKSVKTTEEMTTGNGMSEIQRVQWLLSMPACSNINNAMQEFANARVINTWKALSLDKKETTKTCKRFYHF